MSSPFLLGGGFDLSVLQDGSTPIFVASAQVNDLAPGLPVRTDASHQLVGGLIQLSDCAFTPLANPAATDLNMNSYALDNVHEAALQENATPTTPPTNGVTIFAYGDKLQYVDDTGAIFQVASLTDLTTYLSAYLAKAGGTMTGALNMGTNDITNAGSISATSATLSGALNMGTQEINNVSAIRTTNSNVIVGTSATASATGNVVLGELATATASNGVGIGMQSSVGFNAVSIGKEAVAGQGATVVGYRSSCGTRTDTIIIGRDNGSSGGNNADIIGVNRTNNQANTLLLGNGSYVNIRANNTCDLGTTAIPFQSLYLNGSISGATNSRTADNIVSNAGAGTSGNLASFSGATGKTVTDSGVVAANVVTGPASSVLNRIAVLADTTGKVIADGGATLAQLALLSGAAFTGAISAVGATLSGALAMGGNNITNVGTISGATNSRTADNIVSNTGTGLVGRVVTFVSNKVVQDGGTLLSDLATSAAVATAYLGKAGGTMAGAIAMGGNNITNAGSISGPTWTRTADNIASIPAAQTYGNIAMMSAVTKALEDSGVSSFSVVTGPASAVNNQVALFNGTTGKAIQVGTAAIGTLGALTLANTTASTTTGTGAFICPGGAGIAGNAYVGGNVVAATGTVYGRASQPAVLSKCVQTANVTFIDNIGFLYQTFFTSSVGSLVYAANQSNVSMIIDCTAFYNITAVTSYAQFGFALNGSVKASSTQISTVSKGMVNFRVRIDAAGSMSYAVSLHKDGGNPTFTIGTATTWTVSSSNTIDFNAYFNSNAGTSSMVISNAVITTTYQS